MPATTKPRARLHEADFDNFIDQEAGLAGWEQTYRQLSPGAFHGHISALEWEGMTLYRETVNRRMENLYKVPEGHVCAGFSLGPIRETSDRLGCLPPGAGMIQLAGEEHRIFSEPDADYIILTLPQSRLPEELLAGTGRILHEAGGATLRWMVTLLESARKGMASDRLLELAPDMLLDRISLWTAQTGPGDKPPRCSRSLMDDILAACDTLPAEKLTVSHLARVLQRDRAELRRACQERAGIRLDDLLKGHRLSEVHRCLRMADPHEVRISEVSMEFGYLHWGRFAQSYRAMFGERPSDTLRRPALQ